MWCDAALGFTCASVAGTLGWRCVRGSVMSMRWWVIYCLCVAAATTTVGGHLEGPQSGAMLWFAAAALVLAGIDVLLLRLPNMLVYPTVLVVGVWLPVAAAVTSRPEVAVRVLTAAVPAGLGYLMLHVAAPNGLGMGDVKFAPAIAMVMAWHSWGWVLVSALSAFVLAAVWGMGLMLRRESNKVLPFGPFMVAGTAVTPVIGDPLLQWWW